MTRFGTLVTSTVVAALMSVVPDASGQTRGVPARGEVTLRPIASTMQGSVDGIVMDDAGLPVAGATVSALGATSALAITDRSGRFALANLSPGPYLLRAHVNGYIPSRRQFVEVRAAATTNVAVAMRRTDRTRVMAAGVAGSDAGEDNQPLDDHSEVAWRLRHLPRGVLKDADTADGIVGSDTSRDKSNGFARAVGSPARAASALFDDLPFTGQVNLLTASSFDSVGGLFSSDALSRGVAALSLRGPAGGWGDWSFQGLTAQGDLGSWFVSGTLKSHTTASHAYDVNVAYSAKRSNAAPLVGLPPTSVDDNRAVGTVYAVDHWRVNPQVTLTYAARYSRYDYLGGAGFLSPAAQLALKPTRTVEVRTSVSRHVLVPGAEEFLPPLTAGLWVPTERTFNWLSPTSLRAERTNNYEIAIDHDLGNGYTLTARAFYQEVQNQLVAIFGMGSTSAVPGPYHAGTLGSLDANGWSIGLSNARNKHVRGSIAYEMATTRWHDVEQGGVLAVVAPALIRTSERLHDVVATVDTQVPVTATHVFVLYRIDTGFAARSAGTGSTPGFDARFDVQLSQPLPLLDFTSAQWQVVFAVRNLFRAPSPDGSVYDELLVVRPPKRLVGGLVVRF
ncbi:MAG: TonB-dependent receptor [Bacteroidales bacterium]